MSPSESAVHSRGTNQPAQEEEEASEAMPFGGCQESPARPVARLPHVKERRKPCWILMQATSMMTLKLGGGADGQTEMARH